uniref:polycystic kidney disease protein 1-like 2 n=1 Tax=Solea senegalensis TaxID=28829 RepID=UPI001CD8ACD8|nr:polycystic kidney disease protein 1-like 2 [Solea senegalensis]
MLEERVIKVDHSSQRAEDETDLSVSCPEPQKAFGSSCYEFVSHQRSFSSAQAWCEERGGHLAFIPDEDTQYFLQRHLDPETDTWLGVASPNLQSSAAVAGDLCWLDGSHIIYSNWASSPQPGAACGHILKDSSFQWKATTDCNIDMRYICQFESTRSIVCPAHNIILRCGSAQMLMIDGGFYGRQNIHYCQSTLSSPTSSTQHHCGWLDVGDSLAAHCHGRQDCLVSEFVNSFDDPCPQLGSYLSVDYHCKDGLTLTPSSVAAVFTDITISMKWLLHLPLGKPACRLSTGDGYVVHLNRVEGLKDSVVHKYMYPSTFIVAVECTIDDVLITAQKTITILEPVTAISATRCYAGTRGFNVSMCKVLYGGTFQIQMEANAGSNVSYRIQHDDAVFSSLSVIRGNVPHNVTVTPVMMKQLSPGCHQLAIYASNMVTFPEVSADLQVCVVEKVAGLQASMLTETDDCLDSPDISVVVSLEQGAPVLLLFSLTGDDDTFHETREMNGREGIFHIGNPIQGTVQVKLRAVNDFSSQEVDMDTLTPCGSDTVIKPGGYNDRRLWLNPWMTENLVRVVRSSWEIEANPSKSVDKYRSITLSVDKATSSNQHSSKRYQWECKSPCKCEGRTSEVTHTITKDCLPYPFEFNKYHFSLIQHNVVKKTASICITLIPTYGMLMRLTCTSGCDPVMENKDAKIKISCPLCRQLVWTIEDPRGHENWPAETESCYRESRKRPPILKQTGGQEYTVSYSYLALAKSAGLDVTVVVTSSLSLLSRPYYAKYTIKTSSTAIPAPTTNNPTTMVTTAKAEDTPAAPAAPATPATSATSPPTTTISDPTISDGLSCSISPSRGTVLDAFNITCKTEDPCSYCDYCFKTGGKDLLCSRKSEVRYVFLPLGDSSSDYNLIITATAKKDSFVVSTNIRAWVLDLTEETIDELKVSMEKAVAQLKAQGLLSGETVGQFLISVAKNLDNQSDESKKDDRQQLREDMLDILIGAVEDVPPNTPEEIQVYTRSLIAVSAKGTELTSSAQEDAAFLCVSLSSSLLNMGLNKSEESKREIRSTASIIVEGVGNILSSSAPSRNVSEAILLALKNTQSALLMFIDVNEGPIIIRQPTIGVLVNRMTLGSLHTESIHFPNCSCPRFTLPALPSNILPLEEPVDVKMLVLGENLFAWNKGGNISGQIGDLTLTRQNGSIINVGNLSEDVEILLPRPDGEQVNTLVLDLGNYSTMVIDIPSTDTTLVLKMKPSEDPLPFKLFLGHMSYPSEANYAAMTEMPHQGTTQEQRYTWLVDPTSFKGKTGVYYLVVRPIVGPGIKSINASLSVTSISAACRFWDESLLEWGTNGCRVGVETTSRVTQCLCNHLTFFGSSFFVTPNLVDPSRTAELFSTFAENPVVVCFVGALFVAYLVVVVWARRKDIQDALKVKVTVLKDNNPMDEYTYLLNVCTGHRRGASTSSQVTLTLVGADGNSEPHHLTDPKKRVFERGALDVFLLTTPFSLGELQGIRLWHNNLGSHPAWFVGNVMVQDIQTNQKWYFLCNSWLAIDLGDCSLDKVFPVSTEEELKTFGNLFFMKTAKDLSDGHLWFSVLNRPPSSAFTCVQRVSCCFSLLLCTMLTSLMFYGIPTDPSEQTMDLGSFEFTWQQFMIGVQSSLIMFPVNFLIVSIFRNTRPRETPCCKSKPGKTNGGKQRRTLQTPSSQTAHTDINVNVTLDSITKDISRIALSLSKFVKSNTARTESEFGLERQLDINAALSVVEDFVRGNGDSSGFHNLAQSQLPETGAGVHPGSDVEVIQKSHKTQYLHRQLCHIHKELSLLGSSSFSTTDSYSQALQQVQGIKAILEEQLLPTSVVNSDEITQKKLGSADNTDDEDEQRKRRCCHGGLPWWFVFVGWLIVAGTSFVAAYFTMLYGLKFGKERSISWLVSMVVSFFQSILIIQPLKVLCFAVFFALVVKKIDEDFEKVPFNDSNEGNGEDQQRVGQDQTLYEPPPPADIERMKRNKIIEQKALALLREIFIYIGFMWMLLLVAYGQRDPNAFLLNQHIRKSFSGRVSHSMSIGDVFTWANTSLLDNLFGIYPGFITDGKSKLVGNARLRQLRVQKNSCQFPGLMLQLVPDCHALYSWEVEDMGSYDQGWHQSLSDNSSVSTPSPWMYQTRAQLRASPVWGKMLLYRGGGFVAELGPDLKNASRTLEYLFRNKWLDMYTRALFVEFTVYNANVNLFCIVTLLFETTAVGAFQFHSELRSVRLYQSTGNLHFFVMAAEIIYLLFIIYYMFMQGKLLKQQRWAYFTSKRNLLELSIIVLTWSAVAVFIRRTLLGNRDMTYYQNHKDQFASFYETASTDSVFQYLIAFLVLLATVKLWHLLRLNPKMNIISATLQRAWSDISGFIVIIVIMLIAYSIACNVIYGWKLSSYRTLSDALLTIISLQIGIFNYEEVFDYNPVLTGLLIGSCIMLMTFVMLNLLVSGILVAFNQEQLEHKPSEEKEIVDLMLKKVHSFFGLKYEDTKMTGSRDLNPEEKL